MVISQWILDMRSMYEARMVSQRMLGVRSAYESRMVYHKGI